MELKYNYAALHTNQQFTFNRTKWNWNSNYIIAFKKLETFNRTKWNWNKVKRIVQNNEPTFNRTKWNWNLNTCPVFRSLQTFNRTKWNWNYSKDGNNIVTLTLLIVLNGIEIPVVRVHDKIPSGLLIVLNGIEIKYCLFRSISNSIF